MVENLKTTKYNDGSTIPLINDGKKSNPTNPGYCFYGNDPANKMKYGLLYNWYAVKTGKLAPKGWHVPTDAEWTTLENNMIALRYSYDGATTSNQIAKSMGAPTGWTISQKEGYIGNNQMSNNSSGFTALPGGYFGYGNAYYGIGDYCYWWSSPDNAINNAWYRSLFFGSNSLYRSQGKKSYCFSVRCVRDN
jgi:uncharacterized protein (TIGR02145 family)